MEGKSSTGNVKYDGKYNDGFFLISLKDTYTLKAKTFKAFCRVYNL